MGRGEGAGQGGGEGAGADTGTNVAIGSGVAVLVIVFTCVCGIPMIAAGSVFMTIFLKGTTFWNAGLALVIISCIFLLIGIIFIVLICAGVFNNQSRTTVVGPSTVVVHQQQTGAGALPQAGYSTQQQQPGVVYSQPMAGYSQPGAGYSQPVAGHSQPASGVAPPPPPYGEATAPAYSGPPPPQKMY